MKVVSLFAGAGGLDRGFENEGFDIAWANEHDKTIWETYQTNHPNTFLDRRSILNIPLHEIPDCDGVIGGPPCQSWSNAGALRGIVDGRGKLFFEFLRVIAAKKPKFFLAENVPGMLMERHSLVFENIKRLLSGFGYSLTVALLDAANFGVPQNRKRLFFVGYREDLGLTFRFPETITTKLSISDAIGNLNGIALPALLKNKTNSEACSIFNHEYMTGSFSPMYLSRNRVRNWGEASFTIPASGRHIPIHPQAPKMEKDKNGKMHFVKGKEHLYRRLTVRECARLQTFPDDFVFKYQDVADGYKMVGNAVPVALAEILAAQIARDLKSAKAENDTLQPVFVCEAA